MTPLAAIIVCTRNRAESLRRTLSSILADTSTVSRECIVVDNGSTDHTPDVVAELSRGDAVPLTVVHEPRAGLSNARNRGISETKAEIVLFTDDDVVVHAGWADELVAPFSVSDVGAVGGRIIPIYARPIPNWMKGPHLRTSALADYGEDAKDLSYGDGNLPVGANVAIRRSLLPGLVPFDPHLGHTGAVGLGWEEWHVLRAIERNYRIAYAPRAVAEHHVDPARLDWRTVRRAHFQNGFGFSRHDRLMGEPSPSLPRRLVRTVRALRAARGLAHANAALSEPTPEQANKEFYSYYWAGKNVEGLLQGLPRVAMWAGKHLA